MITSSQREDLSSIKEKHTQVHDILALIISDQKGKKANSFLETLKQSNPDLCDKICLKSADYSDAWLLANFLIHKTMQKQYGNIVNTVHDISHVITSVFSSCRIDMKQKDHLNSLDTNHRKTEHLLDIVQKWNITEILKFLNVLEETGQRNKALCQTIRRSREYQQAIEQMDLLHSGK